ncbi:DNA-3-methyladenine glycosylase 2 family protein [bacterium]|nr:DNA-3-methyladenine glycosylase 2 family protein [bacterium]
MDNNILNKSIKHLEKDQKIKTLINKYPIPEFYPNDNYFDALSKSIIYQQLSGKVAKIIYTRFLSLFKKKIPTPKQYINIKNSDLKGIGLSRQKINYINNLSVFFIEKDNTLQFETESNQEISKQLIEIKGIGQWTIDMFMMFTLCKTDILPVGDLGIKKAFKKLYNLKELPSEIFMKKKALQWQPYRSIACCYLWMLTDDGDVW